MFLSKFACIGLGVWVLARLKNIRSIDTKISRASDYRPKPILVKFG